MRTMVRVDGADDFTDEQEESWFEGKPTKMGYPFFSLVVILQAINLQ